MAISARSFWLREPGHGEIRVEDLPMPGPEDVLVKTLHSGISRGTECIVYRGLVPIGQRASMRAPFQSGEFPGPIKYGYLNVGVVEEGPGHLVGQVVFCLYPHQTSYVVPASSVTVVPTEVPAARAVLAGTLETAINSLWDAAPLIGSRATVVGAGMVGCCVARLLRGIPGVEVCLVDIDPTRALVAESLGVEFALSDAAIGDRDLVIHTSATSEGLQLSLDLLAAEATVIDLSWYGDREVKVSLGAAFHARRLSVRASQVSTISPAMQGRRTSAQRLALALELLKDPAFDALVTGHSPFNELPNVMGSLSNGVLSAICHVIDYEDANV